MIELDAELIHRNHSLQWRDACDFVESFHQRWGNLSGETIMDVGCGTGQNSTRILLENFPELERIIATDGSADMIRMAKELSSHPKVSYCVADIQDEEANRIWFNTMMKVVSIHCFHWLQNQTQAFRNVYEILQPGGRAAILFVLNAPNFIVHEELKKSEKWKNWLVGVDPGTPISQRYQYGEPHYISLLESIGFVVEFSEAREVRFAYPSIEKFRDFCKSVCPLLNHIPDHLRDEFSEDLVKGMLDRCRKSEDGRPNFSCMNLKLMLRKRA